MYIGKGEGVEEATSSLTRREDDTDEVVNVVVVAGWLADVDDEGALW